MKTGYLLTIAGAVPLQPGLMSNHPESVLKKHQTHEEDTGQIIEKKREKAPYIQEDSFCMHEDYI